MPGLWGLDLDLQNRHTAYPRTFCVEITAMVTGAFAVLLVLSSGDVSTVPGSLFKQGTDAQDGKGS